MTASSRDGKLLIMITRNGMGQADAELQLKLIGTYLHLLAENEMLPGAICFYAEGVRLVVEGSPVLDELRSLETKGVHLIICKTCLDYYDVADKIAVGIVGGMTDIIAAQWGAGKVVTV